MTHRNRRMAKFGGAVAVCGVLGAGGAYVGSATSPSSSAAAGSKEGARNVLDAGKRRGPLRPLGRAVHAEAVVPTPGGKFDTVTLDRGAVEKLDGTRLTLKEGTRQATYKTVTLDIPSDAVVRINGQVGELSDVKAGQRAIVVHGPQRTRVVVHDARSGARQ